jgi:hypothetical protein
VFEHRERRLEPLGRRDGAGHLSSAEEDGA